MGYVILLLKGFLMKKSTLEIPTLIGLKVALNVRLAPLCGPNCAGPTPNHLCLMGIFKKVEIFDLIVLWVKL